MVFTLEVIALHNRQVSVLQIMHAFMENLGNISPAEFSVKAFIVNKISHINYNFKGLCKHPETKVSVIKQ